MQIEKGYEKLVAVFQAAHDQAAHGKGKERHANGLPFHEQRMQSISKTLASADGMAYQVVKKMTEGLQFDDNKRREKELLGAINYLAGIVIYFREASDSKDTKEDGNWPESAESRLLQIMQNGNDGEHYHDDMIGKRASGGVIIGFDGDDAIIMSERDVGKMAWGAAIKACNFLEHKGYGDWFLPYKDQLNLAWLNREKMENLGLEGWYWSASQFLTSTAWYQCFTNGSTRSHYKFGIFRARPVRIVKIENLEFEGSEAAIVAQPPGDE